MTDLGLDTSTDHVDNEVLEDGNNCPSKSKKSLKLNKSGKKKKNRDVLNIETDTKV
jgi:hypothetical protein